MQHILEILRDFDFLPDVHAVGGCVRDTLLERPVNDVDLATSATPGQAASLADERGLRVIPTGAEHGTITILRPNAAPIEVTTFRKDVDTDGRRATVRFGRRIEDDLARRDFTINAMAVRGDGTLVDPFGGRRDIERRILRFVGLPSERIHEDYLRAVRAMRFAATLGVTMHDHTREAVEIHAGDVPERVSIERITQEIQKAFATATRPSIMLDLAYQAGLLTHDRVLPEFRGAHELMQNPTHHPEGSVWAHTLEVVDRAPATHRWHALLHDVGKMRTAEPAPGGAYCTFYGHAEVGAQMIPEIARRLTLGNGLRDSVTLVTKLHMHPLNYLQGGGIRAKQIRRLQAAAGPHLEDLAILCRADAGDRRPPEVEQLFTPLDSGVAKPVLLGRHLIEAGFRHASRSAAANELDFSAALDRAYQHQLDTGTVAVEELLDVATRTENPS